MPMAHEMATTEKLADNPGDIDIQHTETGAGSIQPDLKNAPVKIDRVKSADAPDGGLRAWIQVVGCFFLWVNMWGVTFAFGAFQNFYERNYLRSSSTSSIAWIGSIQSFLLIISGMWTGPIFDWGYLMYLVTFGAGLSTFGVFMLSLSTQYWQIFLSQGLCIGFGCGMLFIPSMALIGNSFVKNRSIAVGVTTCGAPVGGIIYTILFQTTLPKFGFPWTARVLAFFMLGSYLIAIPLLLLGARNIKSLSSGERRKLWDAEALKDPPFWSYAMICFTTFMAYLIPYFNMPSYSQAVLGNSESMASWTLITSQAASIPGRLLVGLAANYFGVMVVWASCAIISGIVCFAWIGVDGYAGFVIFCAFYGSFSGPLVPLPPTIFPEVCPDRKVLGTRLGMAQSISSIANLIGPPIAGAILKAQNSDGRHFLGVQLFTGLLMSLGAVQILGLWRLLIRRRGTKFWI